MRIRRMGIRRMGFRNHENSKNYLYSRIKKRSFLKIIKKK
jgi:hypothetical protein